MKTHALASLFPAAGVSTENALASVFTESFVLWSQTNIDHVVINIGKLWGMLLLILVGSLSWSRMFGDSQP